METDWLPRLQALTEFQEREYQSRSLIANLPDEVQALPFWREFVSGSLAGKLSLPFYSLHKPKKNENCFYMGCGPSFLTDPWAEWGANFYGLDLSTTLARAVRARAPQLNGKLFKSLDQGYPHDLERYSIGQFDTVIAGGFSAYVPQDYNERVLREVKRILKPGGLLLWEGVDPESPWFEDWSIGQMYRGLEVNDTLIADWRALFDSFGKVQKQESGELFTWWLVQRS